MNIMELLRSVTNPNQLTKLALMGIRKNNPQMADILSGCIERGESPKQILGEAIEAGKITHAQFKEFRNTLNKASFFLPFKISQSELNDLESMFNNTKNTGFRF